MTDSPTTLPWNSRQAAWLATHFRPDDARELDARMLLCTVSMYALFALGVAGVLPLWLFAALGVPLFIRSFHRMHQAFHAARRGKQRTSLAHLLPLCISPLQLDYASIRRDHQGHHAHADTERDPDSWLTRRRSPLVGLLLSCVQAEVAFLTHVRRHGLSRSLALATLRHVALTAALLASGHALLWFAVTRVGNTLAWYVFDFWLHQPGLFAEGQTLRMPAPVRLLWGLLFSFDNATAVEHHALHHRFAGVPDRRLPQLAALLSDAAPSTSSTHQAPALAA